jgi:hypothetical protein
MRHKVPTSRGCHETYRNDDLTDAQRAWLHALPDTLQIAGLYCSNGTPRSANFDGV